MAETVTHFPTADVHQIELRLVGELERLPGVAAASVWLDQDGRLRDARVHLMPGAAPAIVINGASRVLHALAVPFDPRAIRTCPIALPDELATAMPGPNRSRFLLLQDLTLTRVGAHITCRIQLARDSTTAAGEASELDTSAGRARAAAKATLRAAENVTEGLALGLEAAVITSMFGRNYAVVSVEASVGRKVATLSGIVPVDPARAAEEATCLATLRAIDRWIGM
ncbi:MAG: hypothetical protein KFH98_10575 [Gemmatimonadetes bacterium]|nr:hypothetical protein [Gemmatimonadota bacterium]